MQTIAFMGQKGGTGKTTLAVHAAVAASQAAGRAQEEGAKTAIRE